MEAEEESKRKDEREREGRGQMDSAQGEEENESGETHVIENVGEEHTERAENQTLQYLQEMGEVRRRRLREREAEERGVYRRAGEEARMLFDLPRNADDIEGRRPVQVQIGGVNYQIIDERGDNRTPSDHLEGARTPPNPNDLEHLEEALNQVNHRQNIAGLPGPTSPPSSPEGSSHQGAKSDTTEVDSNIEYYYTDSESNDEELKNRELIANQLLDYHKNIYLMFTKGEGEIVKSAFCRAD